jgi:C-terminal processing protease CtpA/Prc
MKQYEIVKKVHQIIRQNGIPKYIETFNFSFDIKENEPNEDFYKRLNEHIKKYHHHSFIHIPSKISTSREKKRETNERRMPDFRYIKSHNIGIIRFYKFYLADGFWDNPINLKSASNLVSLVREHMEKWIPTMKGLILDFREHRGGAFHPVVEALAPYIDNGGSHMFGFYSRFDTTWVVHKKDKSGIHAFDYTDSRKGLHTKGFGIPVAVIVGKHTGSSGEFCVGSLYGRDKIRLFGENTAGQTSSNEDFSLFGGYFLILTTAFLQTVDGTIHYKEYIKPHVQTTQPMKEAVEWIRHIS